ncbi:MAG: hypothetical protein HY691_18615 [Chloroflexi bacterium]|nr:hypothetical protein [Chloroflexota bacterium]
MDTVHCLASPPHSPSPRAERGTGGEVRARRRFLADESGVVAPVAILLLFVLLGFCALVLDVGLVYAHRRSLQNAADAAALAAALELQRELLGATAEPAGQAEAFAGRNGVPAAPGDCTRDDSGTLVANRVGGQPHSWEVEASRVVPLVFGRAVGVASQCVRARALAVVVELRATKVWPFGVLGGAQRTPGATVVLKQAARDGETGDFGIVDFDAQNVASNCAGGGTPDYEYWSRYGYGTRPGEQVPGRIPPDTWVICTEPGNKASENRRLADYIAEQRAIPCAYGVPDVRCALFGLVPVLAETAWPGGNKTITIVDFAVLELQDVAVAGGGPGVGLMEITGRFLPFAGGVGPTYVPDPSGQLSGIIGVRLWE